MHSNKAQCSQKQMNKFILKKEKKRLTALKTGMRSASLAQAICVHQGWVESGEPTLVSIV